MIDAWRRGMESLRRALEAAQRHTPAPVHVPVHTTEAAAGVAGSLITGRLMLIARIDVKFLGDPIHELWASAAWRLPSTVFLPRFHHWGAANDRFSFGDARLMRKLVRYRLRAAYGGQVATTEQAMCDAILHYNASVALIPVQFVRVRADLSVPSVDSVVVASGDARNAHYGRKWYHSHSNVMCDSCFHSPASGLCLQGDEVLTAGLRPWRWNSSWIQ